MTKANYRPAEKSDCRTVAQLASISSDGVADYIWTQMAEPGQDILDVGEARYRREGVPMSFQNSTLVEVEGQIAGMLLAFPMHIEPDAEPETDPVLAPYSALEEDNSYYIMGVALFPQYRGSGIGSELMAMAESDARDKGFDKLSLVVFEQNSGAHALYLRLGYKERMRASVVPHPLIHFIGEAILMVKTLA